MKLLVLSCDRYEICWKPFFTLLEKYWKNHPEAYLLCETKTCPYCNTINIDNEIWTIRFKKALEQIEDDYVLVMLDDFFIRKEVDTERINKIKFTDDIICYNFELNYREPAYRLKEWDVQKNNQIYLNSCQPTIWNRKLLIERLEGSFNPQEWEEQITDSPYLQFINNKDYIIDIGYRHQELDIGWGITRGKITKECIDFLESEGIYAFNNNTTL